MPQENASHTGQDPRRAEHLCLLVESATDFAMLSLDIHGRYDAWSTGAERILGYTEAEAIGQPSALIFTQEDQEMNQPEKEMQTALREGRAEDERWHLKKDGSRFFASGVMTPIYNQDDVHVGYAKVLRDLTERKHFEDELERFKERLQESIQTMDSRIVERTAEVSAAFAERRSLMERIVQAQEEERRRISRELHDSTGQYMTALSLHLNKLQRTAQAVRESAMEATRTASEAARTALDAARLADEAATTAAKTGATREAARLAGIASEAARTAAISGTDAGAAAAAANTAVTVVDNAAPQLARLRELTASLSRDIHSLAVGLRPTSLDDLGLVPALTILCEDWARRSGVGIEFVPVRMETDRLPPAVETVVYRIVQEALTNVAKYAVPSGATAISVTLQRLDSHVQAVVENDGPGFDVEEATRKGRLGISGMRERAELAGGTLQVESSQTDGTTVFLRVPIHPE